MPIVNHFRKKILSVQRNVLIMQILVRMPQEKGFLEGIFCL